jgi:hypothetical protein
VEADAAQHHQRLALLSDCRPLVSMGHQMCPCLYELPSSARLFFSPPLSLSSVSPSDYPPRSHIASRTRNMTTIPPFVHFDGLKLTAQELKSIFIDVLQGELSELDQKHDCKTYLKGTTNITS